MSQAEVSHAAAAAREETEAELRARILDLVGEHWRRFHQRPAFVPGETRLSYAGRIYGAEEMRNLAGSALDFWLTAGPNALKFEETMKEFFGARRFLAVNSGSSANLIMVSTLCQDELERRLPKTGPRRMVPGDEVITPAVTFPTTLNPILQNGLVPVFVDCELGTYNIDPALIEGAIGPRTRAIFAPHTVGNPLDMDRLTDIAERHNLWLLEDGCDALGATFDGRLVGTFGQMSSLSFYPAHHITMGEGGGVVVNDLALMKTATSMRDWGRDCYCEPGMNDTCGRRFGWTLGDLPPGYDHKYTYSSIGYNLKIGDMQAAVGLAQAARIDDFVARRRANFAHYMDRLAPLEGQIVLPVVHPKASPSPFGFPITVREGIDRNALVRWLEDAKIETRLVFGGNILRQPGYRSIARRVHGELANSDAIMNRALFIGVYPGLTPEMIDYAADAVIAFFRKHG